MLLGSQAATPLFAGFVRNALGSCIDYAPVVSPRPEFGVGELTFELDENLAETSPAYEPESCLPVHRIATASSRKRSLSRPSWRLRRLTADRLNKRQIGQD
jgi:hypothetical protein